MEVRPYYASNEAFARTGEGLILSGYCQRAAAMGYEVLRLVVAVQRPSSLNARNLMVDGRSSTHTCH